MYIILIGSDCEILTKYGALAIPLPSFGGANTVRLCFNYEYEKVHIYNPRTEEAKARGSGQF